MVSLTLASQEVPVMVGLRLFLPENWTSDPRRLAQAHAARVIGRPQGFRIRTRASCNR